MKNKKLFLLFLGIFIILIIPKNVNATATGLRVYQRNSDNTGWNQNANLNTTCYLNQNALIKGQLLRFDFNDTLTNGTAYTLTFNISTQSTLDYAYFRWDNSFGSGGILRGSTYLQPQEPQTKQTLALSSIPMGNYTLYSKSSKIAFDVTPTTTGTFSLDLPTYLLSYSQICLDSYNIRASSSQTNTQDIINNQNSNTQTIINNNNSNTSSIINNQNENTNKQIESQKVCKEKTYTKDNTPIGTDNVYLKSDGSTNSSSSYYISDFYSVSTGDLISIESPNSSNASICFYNDSKVLISCTSYGGGTQSITIPTDSAYFKFTLHKTNTNYFKLLFFKNCKNGNQAISDDLNDLNNTLNDSNVDSATANANANIEGFEIDTHGLGDIFNTIVTFIGNVANSTCNPLQFTLPFVHNEVTLPCMSSVYNQYPTFFTLYQLITTGLIAYRVIINLFQKVKQLSDPSYDKIEVIQL